MSKKPATVIRNAMKGLFMKSVMAEKGWTKEEAEQHLVGWLNCGRAVSLADYFDELHGSVCR
ncbi:hypothetical protein PZT66_23970 [Pseudomonas aeruginosa]|uniref:hypothetical protein n=1 Tax=Pseudomonas aeruginosa group TaxID=136841 RepID=UPI0003BAF0CC|nr:hypothetical protein [Pseudomonas aeruginosa]EIU2716056.1 hypothetical protein [Pseudomonas aeruginosa]EIU2863653.1 hypothetical protein [Pseudomonas aeruginosa]ELD5772865.1 hypothetical protein [Pseudomonas aeruginosa]ERW61309.1 hypothetical protein Q024_06356 [Pseudomonas aeruginosa BWHPSA011]ETV55947.1 hypothetical protein Q042_05356 [Pseudomonas aeruginosa BWHPSA037]